MLSKKSEQFIVELRMFLFSKGKNDADIISIIEELEDHLLQAEADGKSMESIVGNSPKAYMKSIGESMPLDFCELAGLIPMTILLIAAYISLPFTILGQFALSPIILVVVVIGSILGFGLFGFFLVKGIPKLLHSTWKTFFGISIINVVVTSGMVLGFLWWDKQGFKPTFVATSFQNKMILVVCIAIFIISAIYMKSWINIIIPAFVAFTAIINILVVDTDIKESTIITIYIGLFLFIGIIYFFFRKSKKSSIA